MSNEILTTALRFASAGIVAVPVASDGSKRPGLNSWKEYQHQMPTPEELISWFKADSEGVGVICGAISGNLEMLELEGRAVSAKMHLEIAEIANASNMGELWERINAADYKALDSGHRGTLAETCRWANLTDIETNYILAYKALEDVTL